MEYSSTYKCIKTHSLTKFIKQRDIIVLICTTHNHAHVSARASKTCARGKSIIYYSFRRSRLLITIRGLSTGCLEAIRTKSRREKEIAENVDSDSAINSRNACSKQAGHFRCYPTRDIENVRTNSFNLPAAEARAPYSRCVSVRNVRIYDISRARKKRNALQEGCGG